MPNRIPELEAALADAKKKYSEDAKSELERIPLEYVWKVTWKSKHVVRVMRKLSLETMEAFEAWKKEYPKQLYPGFWLDGWQGMDHVVIGNALLRVGGGYILLKSATNDPFSYEPLFMTDEETELLRQGIISDSLKLEKK